MAGSSRLTELRAFLRGVAQRASKAGVYRDVYFGTRTIHDDEDEAYLAVPKHWNSDTPVVPQMVRPVDRYRRLKGYTLGGGYFLVAHGWGIAVDPGHNFAQMLFSEYGFTIRDIDAVIVTHDHPDHWGDLPNITVLRHIAERRATKRTDKEELLRRPLALFLDPRTADALQGLLEPSLSPRTIVPGMECHLPRGERPTGIRVRFLKAFHSEREPTPGTHGHAVGLAITVDGMPRGPNGRSTRTIVISGDTQYPRRAKVHPRYGTHEFTEHDEKLWADQYRGLREATDILCLHLGSAEKRFGDDDCTFTTRRQLLDICYEGYHLGFVGCLQLLDDLFPPRSRTRGLAVLSEFGEELRGVRAETARWLQAMALANSETPRRWRSAAGHVPGPGSRARFRRPSCATRVPVLPADLGLLVDLKTGQILCTTCRGNRVCALEGCPMEERGCGFPAWRDRSTAGTGTGEEEQLPFRRDIDLGRWFGRRNDALFHPPGKLRYYEDTLEELIHYTCEMGSGQQPLMCGACPEGQKRCEAEG